MAIDSIDFGVDASKTYAVAMSGGVDSSTTAAIIKHFGAKLFGVTLYLHEYSVNAVSDAKNVCSLLDIEHHVIDARDAFGKNIIDNFYESYANGITPNPCALCNRDIKFGLMLQFAQSLGADFLSTGHYASCAYKDDQCWLLDVGNSKDQTYFLSLVNCDHLRYAFFPLSKMLDKSQTRKIAKDFGMSFFDTVKESQDICFLPGENYQRELLSRVKMQPGNVVKRGVGVIGSHDGIGNYTIGQRRGLALSWGNKPLYVVEINHDTNEVIVDNIDQTIDIQFVIENVNWLLKTDAQFSCWLKPRYRIQKICGVVEKIPNTERAVVRCNYYPTIIAPGQICVMYNDDGYVIGGGIITK